MRTAGILMASAAALTVLLPYRVEGQQDPALVARGAEAYLNTCSRCHVPRPGAERADREWEVIVAHMRARANLSKSTAEAILAFLKATNEPEPAGGSDQ